MPTYEYKCEPCRVICLVDHPMREQPTISCPECAAATSRMILAPNPNLGGYTGPTQAKYANMSDKAEIAREHELQMTDRTIWLPPPVKHNPWDDH